MTLQVYRIGLAAARTVDDQAYGSALFDGRWHTVRSGPKPRRVIYAAATRALAQLEKRVHANGISPIRQALFRLGLPGKLKIAHARDKALPAGWREDMSLSQVFGDAWLDRGDELALWVPSYVEPAEDNLLIHPDHPKIGDVTLAIEREPFEFDPRLA